MKIKNINKENLAVLFCVLIGTLFLLSTIGKYFNLLSFQKSIMIYGLPNYVSYIVLAIEMILALCFMFLVFLKQAARFSLVFVILMTIINTIGHYFLNIESCECFGRIYFLNPNSFILFLCKNVFLILLLFYIFKEAKSVQSRIWMKRITVISISLITVFISFHYNSYYIENYTQRKIGRSLKELNIVPDKIKGFNYLFFFSPSCIHCKKAIPKINLLKEKYSVNIVGILSNSKIQELKELKKELSINFEVIAIKKEVFKEVTLQVPIVLKIENDTIKRVLEVKELLNVTSFVQR